MNNASIVDYGTISSYQELESAFCIHSSYIQTFSVISKDNSISGKVIYISKSEEIAYCFDSIIQKLSRKRGGHPFCSVDAISFRDGYVNFIEFKNSRLDDKVKYNLYAKIAHSYRYFEKIVLNSQYFDKLGIRTRFILVYNPQKLKNGPDSYQKINSGINSWAKKASPIDEKLKVVKNDCNWLQFFDDIQSKSVEEFDRNASSYGMK